MKILNFHSMFFQFYLGLWLDARERCLFKISNGVKRVKNYRNTDFLEAILYKNTKIVTNRLIQISTDDDRVEKSTISGAQRSEPFRFH